MLVTNASQKLLVGTLVIKKELKEPTPKEFFKGKLPKNCNFAIKSSHDHDPLRMILNYFFFFSFRPFISSMVKKLKF